MYSFAKYIKVIILTSMLSAFSPVVLAVTKKSEPTWTTYKVQKGDSLYRLAKRYRTTIENIKRSNHLTTSRIRVGQKILIGQKKFTRRRDVSRSEGLAKEARRYGEKNGKTGHCLRGFRIALHEYVKKMTPKSKKLPYLGADPAEFISSIEANPGFLRNLGLVRYFPHHLSQLRVGSVLAYRPGTCGFSKKHGHIEVLVNSDSRRVCSDHCSIRSSSCQPDYVFMPINS